MNFRVYGRSGIPDNYKQSHEPIAGVFLTVGFLSSDPQAAPYQFWQLTKAKKADTFTEEVGSSSNK